MGINSYDFKFEYEEGVTEDVLVDTSPGFNVGLLSNLRINDYFDLRFEPGLIITDRILNYKDSHFDIVGEEVEIKNSWLIREVKSTYIHLPLLLKISTKRLYNFKPFIVTGLSTAVNLSSNENNPNDNLSGQFRSVKNMSFYELGFGIDFYLEWFKFTPSIRGVFAMNNEMVPDNNNSVSPWTGNIASMKTRGVFFNFTFQ